MSAFSDNLRQIRKSSRLNMEQLATQIGTSITQIARWERGDTSPSIDNTLLLAKTLNVSLDELCGLNTTTKDHLDISGLTEQQQKAVRTIVEGLN